MDFAAGEILPSGEVADKEYRFIEIKAGSNPLLKANIKMSGDLPLMSEEFATMDFEGSANKTDEGYYTHYIQQTRE